MTPDVDASSSPFHTMLPPQTTMKANNSTWKSSIFVLLVLQWFGTRTCTQALLLDASSRIARVPSQQTKWRLHAVTNSVSAEETQRQMVKDQLLSLVSSTPANAPTSSRTTQDILQVIRELEQLCPTPEPDVVPKLGGNWELLWTTQDQSSDEWGMGPFRTWINPLENQSYSNNPNGRSNPVLPRPIQDRLEKIGVIQQDADPIRSSQAIDLKKGQVRNVVTFTLPSLFPGGGGGKPSKATLTVTVDFQPNTQDSRKVDVKFQACRVVITNTPVDVNIPLGIIGPTGWLRTGYIDETMRITRGHKGSVFVLSRPSKQSRSQ